MHKLAPPSGDAFVEELKKEKEAVAQKLASKKQELSQLEREQRSLSSLIESEKHQTPSGHHPKHHKKGKEHDQTKQVRLDIVRNEQKFKEQARKVDELRKEVGHLESDLKGINHDLSVVEQGH